MTNKFQRRELLTRERVIEVLEGAANVTAAARELGVHRTSLYRYLREQGLRIETGKRRVVAA